MSASQAPSEDARLLEELRDAVRGAKARPSAIEVGIPLSVALGRARGSVSCGGCQVPLELDGIPTRTNVHLRVPFRLIVEEPSG